MHEKKKKIIIHSLYVPPPIELSLFYILQDFVFLILSLLVTPIVCLKYFISAASILLSCLFERVQKFSIYQD